MITTAEAKAVCLLAAKCVDATRKNPLISDDDKNVKALTRYVALLTVPPAARAQANKALTDAYLLGQAAPGMGPNWRVVRDAKQKFAVARERNGVIQYLRSASGRPSSFKTWLGARRAMIDANAVAVSSTT